MVAKLDVGAKGAVVTFADGGFPDLAGLLGYIERLKGSAKLRPDSKLTVARDWPTPERGSTARCSFRAASPGSPRRGEKKEAVAGLGGSRRARRSTKRVSSSCVERAGAEEALVEIAAPFGEQRELARCFRPLRRRP